MGGVKSRRTADGTGRLTSTTPPKKVVTARNKKSPLVTQVERNPSQVDLERAKAVVPPTQSGQAIESRHKTRAAQDTSISESQGLLDRIQAALAEKEEELRKATELHTDTARQLNEKEEELRKATELHTDTARQLNSVNTSLKEIEKERKTHLDRIAVQVSILEQERQEQSILIDLLSTRTTMESFGQAKQHIQLLTAQVIHSQQELAIARRQLAEQQAQVELFSSLHIEAKNALADVQKQLTQAQTESQTRIDELSVASRDNEISRSSLTKQVLHTQQELAIAQQQFGEQRAQVELLSSLHIEAKNALVDVQKQLTQAQTESQRRIDELSVASRNNEISRSSLTKQVLHTQQELAIAQQQFGEQRAQVDLLSSLHIEAKNALVDEQEQRSQERAESKVRISELSESLYVESRRGLIATISLVLVVLVLIILCR